jgi:hypothetical protein
MDSDASEYQEPNSYSNKILVNFMSSHPRQQKHGCKT